uniref:Uncharacterized protein n=1 Tax=Trichobilharzia regenti TaxID=157069 RepID=A0AA85KAU0_TRIRE|nr:unnamed protein product [Trichobilharzia regenti]
MFSLMYTHISVITLLVFSAINKGESTTLDYVEKLLSKSRDELPGSAQSIIDNEAEIKKLRDKIKNEAAEIDNNNNVDNYIKCWRQNYEIFTGQDLFKDVVWRLTDPSEEYGPYSQDYPLQQCVQKQVDKYSAQIPSVEAVNCELYRPSADEEDIEKLHQYMEYSYHFRKNFGRTILFKRIYEATIERLKQKGRRN